MYKKFNSVLKIDIKCYAHFVFIHCMKEINASIYVMDYDYNAPNLNHLQDTHYLFYKTIRKRNPLTLIIFISKPNFENVTQSEERSKIIRETYEKAISEGDYFVDFIDG